jgi:phosphoglycerate dehydrogenase-like enzyme
MGDMRVWVPYAEVVPQLPATLSVDVYSGEDPPLSTIGEVEFYVTPYRLDDKPVALIPRMPRLRVVQTLTAGVDHVLPYLREGLVLCNAGSLHDTSTAELAVTLTLAALRGIPDFVRDQESRRWRPVRNDALADKTVLIVGYGGIGRAIERRLAGFEVDVLRVARQAREGVATPAELPELLPRADVVILCTPLTAETRSMVDKDFLARMRDNALLVNVSRGPVVDTAALLAELTAGRLRAALDVTDPEPPPPDHPLWDAPNLLVSPHVGGNSTAFLPRAHRLIVEQLNRHAAGEPLQYRVG